ncbi:post-GPI attachment to proteins factor 2-like [Pollicipes pollicipes]|uniref:post-GPI attachment to proteins factor 2-like n=1 Tax=Pollicipes pollicipes TaxID=41117 RepID=UPI0018858D7C|nr:post-GPI attachment to proteins factor 2-like [Pollicipes pollicipes]XP_037072814.1 post-GPI attachment to proteins factor 2-like [Pollicipes pollicipes]XP_037072816.1 post-GPI attachment to proteins factor 2-like [Pollicipes pollicipes]XP_037072817.1 post-GPI attachment to proteins factor 2-like [Pollicipes pollicipes]
MSDQASYQLLGERSRWPARLHFRHLAFTVVAMPLGGFLFCVGWSLCYNFDAATSTHCDVPNYLPSISAAIGSFPVQRRVWKTLIALQALPRFLVGFFYHEYWQDTLVLTSASRCLLLLAEILYVSENLGLIGLSFVASADNFPFHKMSFIVFLVSSEFYMLLTCRLFRLARSKGITRLEVISRRQKLIIFIINLTSLVFAMHFYARHNRLCEPGVYTMFALCEYFVVLSNMAFHMTAYWDFHDKVLDLNNFSLR